MVVIGASSEPIPTIQQFVAEQGVTFPVIHDQGNRLHDDLYRLDGGISPYPRDFIIDRQGIIRYARTEYDVRAMTLIVESLLEDPTNVETKREKQPSGFALEQNYPNPFNPRTTIRFTTAKHGFVRLAVFNALGEKIKTLISAEKPPGTHTAIWEGLNDRGHPAPAGLYFYRLEMENSFMTKKMILLK